MATHRTSRVILGFAAAAVVAQLAPPAWARKARPTPCPGGRFVVHDTPLLGGAAGPQPDIVVFDAAHLAVASGCPATTLKRSASRRGTTLKAAFPRCAGVTGTVKLTAKVEPTCHTMTGTLAARKSRPRFRRQFSAGLEQCDTGGDCGANTSTVRYCAYVPGLSQAATMPPEVVNPPPTTSTTLPPLPPSTAVPPATTQAQTDIFTAIRQVVADNYIYPNFRGVDWTGIGATYAALIQAGLTDDDFHAAMQRMILELGDDHSHYMTPQEVADEAAEQARGMDFVGIGVLAQPLRGTGTATIIVTYPGSPAREAGLRPHDVLRTVDGQPAFDETTGQSTLRGPAGTQLALAFQRPGESPRTISAVR